MTKFNINIMDYASELITKKRHRGDASDDIAEQVFSMLDRAPWWEEVGEDYEFCEGEPIRTEWSSGHSFEHESFSYTMPQSPGPSGTYCRFRDTRWVAPPPPLKVGESILSAKMLAALPVDSLVEEKGRKVWHKENGIHFHLLGGESRSLASGLFEHGKDLFIMWMPPEDTE